MKKSRISTVLNIISMSVSLMVFLVLFAQVWFDYSFNRNFNDYRNIYRYDEPVKDDAFDYNYDHIIRKDVIEGFKSSSPDIVAVCDYADAEIMVLDFKMCYNDNGEIKKYDIPWTCTDTDFTDVFELEFVAGSADDYNRMNAALISEDYARMIFGDRNPIGEVLTLEMLQYEYPIVGVYKTLPENCTVINGMLVNDGGTQDTFIGCHSAYFRLKDGADPEEVLKNLPGASAGSRLIPISKGHFLSELRPGIKQSGNRAQALILLSISLLFLAIAIFNYINFAIASIPFRINEINIEKVYGASRGRLILNQLKSNLGICLISFTFAVILMEIVAGSGFAAFSVCSLAVKDNLSSIIICLIVAVIAAAAGGLVTALYSTSFAPGMVLKGEFAISGRGTAFRKTSMLLQFILSCVFLISGLVISRQTNYMVNQDNGFESENVLHMNTILYNNWQDYFYMIKENPQVLEVTAGDSPMAEGLMSRNQMMSKNNVNEWYSIRNAHTSYLDFFGFELVEGRFPNEGENGKAIVNETFASTYPDCVIGSKLTWTSEHEIIGVVKDFNARPLMHKPEPVLYIIGDEFSNADIYIKLSGDNMEETVKWVTETIGGLFTFNGDSLPWEASFLDDEIRNMYSKEIGQSELITDSSILCLLIALIGVLGIVYFETQVMRKEIAVRKVNGATTWEIIKSLLCKYLFISSAGFLVAVPVSVLTMKWWLSGFADRTDMPTWLFLLAYLIITALTAAVVIIRSYTAASENPVDALKKE